NVGHYHRTKSNETTVTNLHERVFVQDATTNFGGIMNVLIGVRRVYYGAVACNADVVSNVDAGLAHNVDILLDVDVVADRQSGDTRRVLDDRFQARAFSDMDRLPKMDELWIFEKHWSANDASSSHATEHSLVKNNRLELPVLRSD